MVFPPEICWVYYFVLVLVFEHHPVVSLWFLDVSSFSLKDYNSQKVPSWIPRCRSNVMKCPGATPHTAFCWFKQPELWFSWMKNINYTLLLLQNPKYLGTSVVVFNQLFNNFSHIQEAYTSLVSFPKTSIPFVMLDIRTASPCNLPFIVISCGRRLLSLFRATQSVSFFFSPPFLLQSVAISVHHRHTHTSNANVITKST